MNKQQEDRERLKETRVQTPERTWSIQTASSHEDLSPELSIKPICSSLTGQDTPLNPIQTLPAMLRQPQTCFAVPAL